VPELDRWQNQEEQAGVEPNRSIGTKRGAKNARTSTNAIYFSAE